MRRVRIGIIGSGSLVEGAILPALSSATMGQPPDEGAWWRLRPSAHADIVYQAPFRPDVVALCDRDAERVGRVANAHRVRGVYTDWRAMIAEAELDVLICAAAPATTTKVLCDLGTRRFDAIAPWIWVAGPPALSAKAAREMARLHAHRPVWMARPLSQAAAHRAARRLIDHDEIGRIEALHGRWSAPLCAMSAPQNADSGTESLPHFSSSFAAFDLVLGLGASRSDASARPPQRVATVACGGASSVLLQLASGSAATMMFSAADEWNAALPRLEISGQDGRVLICEGGREVRLSQPREATRTLSLPGLATASPSAVVSGVAEDLKCFFGLWSQAHNASTPFEASATFQDLGGAVPVLQAMEAASEAARSGAMVEIEAVGSTETAASVPGRMARALPTSNAKASTASEANGTLPLLF